MGVNKDFFALDWIKSEVDATLKLASRSLETYAESSDEAAMRSCLAFIHQVHGTLLMLELKGVAVLSAEMEQLAEAMLQDSFGEKAEVQQLLMQGILQLPAFLEDIQEGRADRRQMVLPLANEMRVLRGGDAFGDFDANQGNLYQRPSEEALNQFDRIGGREKTARIRTTYQQVLLSVIKGERLESALSTLAKVATGMERLCQGTPVSTLFGAFGGFIESLSKGGDAQLDKNVIKLLRQIDAELKTLAADGRAALQQPVQLDLIRRLIDAAEERQFVSDKLRQISGTIDQADKSEPATISSRDAKNTAASALREELLAIRDKLDLGVRGESPALEKMKELTEPLKKIGSTLAVLGYESAHSIITDQVEKLGALTGSDTVDESVLLNIASSLLQVDENLSGLSTSRSDESGVQPMGTLIGDAQITVLFEVRNGLEAVKQRVVQYASSQWNAEHLTEVPDLLMGIKGALSMIPLSRPADLLERCADYVQRVWVSGYKPDWSALDVFADAISGIDYYLERLGENTVPQSDDILVLVEQSLSQLDDKEAPAAQDSAAQDSATQNSTASIESVPQVEDRANAPESVSFAEQEAPEKIEETLEAEPPLEVEASAVSLLDSPIDSIDSASEETVIEEAASVEIDIDIDFEETLEATPDQQASSLEASSAVNEISTPEAQASERERPDEEIIEIFVEEVTEVIEGFDAWLPAWAANSGDTDVLVEIRRGFHTLKGSGRIVTADLLGELAWSIENLLNRILDETLSVNAHIHEVIADARALLPDLCRAFELQQEAHVELASAIIERADVLASGGMPEDRESVQMPGQTEAEESFADNSDLEESLNQTVQHSNDFDTFDEQATTYMAVLKDFVDNNSETKEVVLEKSVVSALQSLVDSASVLGVDSISAVAEPLQEVAVQIDERGGSASNEHFDFLLQGVYALESIFVELRDGKTPDEDGLIFAAEADRLLTQSVTQESASILGLDATPVLLELHEFINNWRNGSEDLAQRENILSALADVSAYAKQWGYEPVAGLSDSLGAALTRFKDSTLNDRAYVVFDEAQELLVASFDCIAAQQQLPITDSLVEALSSLTRDDEPEVLEAGAIETTVAATDVIEHTAEDTLEAAELFDLDDLDLGEDLEAVADSVAEESEEQTEDSIEEVLQPIDEVLQAEAQTEEPVIEESSIEEQIEEPVEESQQLEAQSEEQPITEVQAEPFSTESLETPEDIDLEIVEIFYEEADELMEAMDQSVNDWVSERDNEVHLENLLRILHTLKGGARLAGIMKLGDLTHEFESYLVGLQNRGVKPDDAFFKDLHVRFDEVTNLLARYKTVTNAPQTAPEMLNAEIITEAGIEEKAIGSSQIGSDQIEASAEQWPVQNELSVAAAAKSVSAETVSDKTPDKAEAKQTEAPVAAAVEAPKEMVRVSSVLLEKLVNLAGESSIIRSRVEQTISDFGQALGEMDITISRLRDQLRRMEIETETQVLFRTEREGPNHADFDPLEMDRYSRMQEIARTLSESTSDMFELKDALRVKARDSETLLIQQARLNSELQEGLMHTRMVPFSRMLPRLKRIVRQVSGELGKEVELVAINAEGEMDRNIIERMVPPLEHLLRNAIDHGIESAEERSIAGKSATGRIELTLSREAGDILLEINDDGRGIDIGSVRNKAIERGLMEKGANLSDDQILQFVLAPGFSTAESVTQISGRGVGMDVVHSEVKRLGGSIDIVSNIGNGTRITLRLPFTVSVNRALMVLVGDDQYAIPLNSIEGIVRIPLSEFEDMNEPDQQTFEYAGIPYRLRFLGNYLGREFAIKPDQASVPVVLVRSGDQAMALYVNSVQGSREIIVKSLGPQFAGVGGISGATILGDGNVVVILDLLSLIRGRANGENFVAPKIIEEEQQPRCIMVVDDSVTVRKVTSRLLERQGMEVIVAKDGVEAIELLQEKCPDVMLLDIEMPRMDGFEVARQVRHDASVSNLPIIMISSRTGAKHQEHAGALGVDKFLGKPFQESELLATIEELLVSSNSRPRPQI